ncbi:MAG: amidophosphoribosyltransferase [Candidatus Parcubacteria bacterium]|nr:amidophosphoribosyltransferase [Candidatus Parcubacteria bacterium]
MSGLFGVISKENCSYHIWRGTNAHSHLGNAIGGMVTWDNGPRLAIHKITETPFLSRLANDLSRLTGEMGIGVISSDDVQPLPFHTKNGEFAICVQGNIQNLHELGEKLRNEGRTFTEMTDDEKRKSWNYNKAEVVGQIIAKGNNFVDGINKVWQAIDGKGSISLLLLCPQGIYIARSKRGTFSLTIGVKKDAWAVASETTAFPNLGFEREHELQAGEIGLLNEKGYEILQEGSDTSKICAFLYVYTAFPSAIIENRCVETIRYALGALLWKKFHALGLNCDYLTGIPDSGTAHGIGAAIASGKPFKRPMLKKGDTRSYIYPNQELRDDAAHHKIIVVKELINDQTIFMLDDSLVRNTQFRKLIKKISDCRPKGIYLGLACPPLVQTCPFEVSTRERAELAACRAMVAKEGKPIEEIDMRPYLDPATEEYQFMVDWIRRDVNRESEIEVVKQIIYPTMEETISCIGLPTNRLCTYCWTGQM